MEQSSWLTSGPIQCGYVFDAVFWRAVAPAKDVYEKNLSSTANTNTPWMYPAVLPIIREAIKWRYEHLSYFHSLIWELHDHSFTSKTALIDSMLGLVLVKSLLLLLCERANSLNRLLSKTSANDQSLHFDLNAPYGSYRAGTKVTIATPLEHFGMLARKGAVIPIGKWYETVTQ
ncbi:hypothetical protein L204_100921 [Cryptococcus depauperatus]